MIEKVVYVVGKEYSIKLPLLQILWLLFEQQIYYSVWYKYKLLIGYFLTSFFKCHVIDL